MTLTVAIIGSQGYIGSFLTKQLAQIGFNVKGFDRVIYDRTIRHQVKDAKDLGKDDLHDAQAIIYLAGYSTRADSYSTSAEQLFAENVTVPVNIATSLHANQVFIYASTAAIDARSCTDAYTLSMVAREREIEQAVNIGKIQAKCIGLRFATVTGASPCQNTDFVMMSMLRSALLQGRIHAKNASSKRGLLWNKDLLRAIIAVINSHKQLPNHKVYTLVSYNTSIAKIANNIASRTNCIIDWDSQDVNSIDDGFVSSNDKFAKDFSFVFQGNFSNMFQDLYDNVASIVKGKEKLEMPGHCRVCKAQSLLSLLDLGAQPLANNFTTTKQEQEVYPLHLVRCKECHHTQLSFTVDPVKMFSNYLYASATSQTLQEHFQALAQQLNNKFANKPMKTVLEIACNDGSQLDCFKQLGWSTYGVDPATNLTEVADLKGHKVFNGFWGTDKFDLPNVEIDVILGQNVFAHVPDPLLFLQECARVASENTLIVMQTSQCEMLFTGEFDTVYHEHLSFYTAHSLAKIASLSGLAVVDLQKPPIHGTSFLVTFQKTNQPHCQALLDAMTQEQFDDVFFIRYREKAYMLKSWLNQTLQLLEKEYTLYAYGAAAKGMTILNFAKPRNIQAIFDDAPLKQNTYSPGLNIPVKPSSELANCEDKVAIIVFAWNFLPEIQRKIKTLRGDKKTLLVVPFPQQRVIDLQSNQVVMSNMVKQAPLSLNALPRVLLTSHFYNEEVLLRTWIRTNSMHAEKAILIDYASTDRSRQIIEEEAPDNWIVVQSKNQYFAPEEVDKEVLEYEKMYRNEWTISLNTTEFLLHPCLRYSLLQRSEDVLRFQCHTLVGPNNNLWLDDIPIAQQRWLYNWYLSSNYSRYLHRSTTLDYNVGRHSLKCIQNDQLNAECFVDNIEGLLCKALAAPYPQIAIRKMQVQTRLPLKDIEKGWGTQHVIKDLDELNKQIEKVYNFGPFQDLSKSNVWQNLYKYKVQ